MLTHYPVQWFMRRRTGGSNLRQIGEHLLG